MTGNAVQVFVAAFDDETQAADTLKEFRAMDRDGSLDLIDAAVVTRRPDGKVTFSETADPSGKTWAKRGVLAGGLVGLIFPPSILVSAAVGGVGGGIWGKIRDKGFDDEQLKRIGESLPPGGSAVIAIAEDRVVEQLERAIAGYTSIAKHALSAEAAAVIVTDDESGQAPST
jgi:uncharacterized membrane protein